jgi:hypothetical protein
MDSYLALGHRFRVLVLLALGFVLLTPLVAESASGETPPGVAIIEGTTSQGFPYLSGGVSTDEREAMRARAGAYNAQLIFAEKGGAYLAGVKLVIEGPKGERIVEVTTNGPWFYIQLPSGNYRARAAFNGKAKEARLNLSQGKTAQQTFVWDLGNTAE